MLVVVFQETFGFNIAATSGLVSSSFCQVNLPYPHDSENFLELLTTYIKIPAFFVAGKSQMQLQEKNFVQRQEP
ncbi:hypothetical protein [Nostoc sp. C057]|uniref:hypothetical protein n=1 Tax=Nostoc sp. C057 TaxID=2576903 RepID=UPI0015C3AAE6|nr:hypothetical protein [Nostoc sp. C057]